MTTVLLEIDDCQQCKYAVRQVEWVSDLKDKENFIPVNSRFCELKQKKADPENIPDWCPLINKKN
jgi:hypothetical protein